MFKEKLHQTLALASTQPAPQIRRQETQSFAHGYTGVSNESSESGETGDTGNNKSGDFMKLFSSE